jgi:hypothetical protein
LIRAVKAHRRRTRYTVGGEVMAARRAMDAREAVSEDAALGQRRNARSTCRERAGTDAGDTSGVRIGDPHFLLRRAAGSYANPTDRSAKAPLSWARVANGIANAWMTSPGDAWQLIDGGRCHNIHSCPGSNHGIPRPLPKDPTMPHVRRQPSWLSNVLVALVVVLSASSAGIVDAAETNKIHILETKWGDYASEKTTCAPDLSRCEGQGKCVVPPKDYQCKTATKPKPDEIQLNIIWDCGEFAHAAGHGAGPGTGRQTYTLTCPYIPRLNP